MLKETKWEKLPVLLLCCFLSETTVLRNFEALQIRNQPIKKKYCIVTPDN